MSKETELRDEQIDNCVGNLGMAENSILVGPEEIRKAMRAVIAADRELCRGDARMPPLPEPWQGFQFNPGWNTWENVVRGAINEPRVMKAFTAEQMHEYAQAALADAQAVAERMKLEAQIHAQEARTANATIAEIYQLCTGATGEPGNWHGAEPVRVALAVKDAKILALEAQITVLKNSVQR